MKIRLPILFLVSVVTFGAIDTVSALSYSTPDSQFTGHVACMLGSSEIMAARDTPLNWSDLEVLYGKPIDEVYKHLMPTKRYSFITGDVILERPHAGRLVLATRRPYREITKKMGLLGISNSLRDPGRSVVYQSDDGRFLRAYIDEAAIVAAFAGAGVDLPEPDSEPARAHEAQVVREQWTKRSLGGLLCLLLGWWVCSRLLRRTQHNRAQQGA